MFVEFSRAAILAPILLTVIAAVGCTPEQLATKTENAGQAGNIKRTTKQFAGSARCSDCHPDIAQKFSSHPMARSAGVVDASAVYVESFEPNAAEFQHPGFVYRSRRADDGGMVHSEATNSENTVTYSQSVSIDFYIGSGERGRSYLIKRDDMLFQSPITWYSHKKRWDLSPGYEYTNKHFDRRISAACVACHFGRANPLPDDANRFREPMFAELGIGCENCHGPAADHVAWHESPDLGQDLSTDPILKISSLDHGKRDSICYQCHLVADDRVLQVGKTPFDFRPGQDLAETWICFVDGDTTSEDGQKAVSHVEQMRSSICFLKSDPKMTCTSCHDPHFSPRGLDAIKFYRQQCLACHSGSQSQCSEPQIERLKVSEHDACADCHMPRMQSADVAHTSLTDHRILKNRSAAANNAGQNSGESLHPFAETQKQVSETAMHRALLIVTSRHCIEEGDQHSAVHLAPMIEDYLAEHSDDVEMLYYAGCLHYLVRDSLKAQARLESVLAIQPKHEEALRKLLLIAHESNSLRTGVHYGREFLKINQWDPNVTGRLIHLLGQTQELDEAIKLARTAVERFPADQQIKIWLERAEAFQSQRSGSVER